MIPAHTFPPGLLADHQIAALCQGSAPMIAPFVDKQVTQDDRGQRVISWGLSSFGYDARPAAEWVLFERSSRPLDPLDFHAEPTERSSEPSLIIPPHGFALARTMERFSMPADVLAVCLGKSTYARLGLVVNVTPLEPGWEGEVTLELSNTAPRPIKVHAGMGLCQFLFFRGAAPAITYADRAGKYQSQAGITFPRMK
jgi:dCTP deaminase